jgi:glycerol-3-phosphate acyltransferase PlsY
LKNLLLLAPLIYLAASINFSIFLFKVLGKGDPREKFSGNAGAVNVTRQLGLVWGVAILILDVGRAAAVGLVGAWLLPVFWVPFLGFFLVLGNQKPLFHGFQGGKGVASFLGFTLVISPVSSGISCLVWVVAYGLFRQPFIGSFFMIASLGLGTMAHYSWAWQAVTGSALTMALIFLVHKTNVIDYIHQKEFLKKGSVAEKA